VIGYIEEIAHNVDFACGVGGWLYEAFGNYTSQAVTPKVASCPEIDRFIVSSVRKDADTSRYYVAHGFTLPPNVPGNLFDRIYRHLFRQLEPKAGNRLLPRFYEEIKKSSVPRVRSRAEQAYVVAQVFSKVTGEDVAGLFRRCGIAVRQPPSKKADR
jgi:hypothetical protein